MTTISIKKTEYGNEAVFVNNRFTTMNGRITALSKVGAGKWLGELSNGYDFEMFGGRAAGGSAKDWFVRCEKLTGDYTHHVTSAKAAIQFLDNI